MFENLLGQGVRGQLIEDIETGVLAPAMLFSGPPASGKGTAALELGRVISCEAGGGLKADGSRRAEWNCACPACARHRLLLHPDLLCLGWRPFSAEIAASAGTFRREPGVSSSRLLFIRSVRKLLARFHPALWEDDPKAAKVSPLVASIEEGLDELEAAESLSTERISGEQNPAEEGALTKLVEGMIKNAFRLESEGVSEAIPVAQIKRAAWWSRLAPAGREKLIVIENADRMHEEARNSLLKLLEEPPGRSRYVLCSSRPPALNATILSRLRPYRFASRDAAAEAEVIRRVYRDKTAAAGIGAYLDSFLPVSGETLSALAAFFAASAAFRAAVLLKKQGRPLPDEVVLLGKSAAPLAEAAGLGRPLDDSAGVIALVLEKAGKFEVRSLFSRFLACLLEQVSASFRNTDASISVMPPDFKPPAPRYNDLWKKCSAWAETAAGIYNLRPAVVLEKLFTDLSRGMAEL